MICTNTVNIVNCVLNITVSLMISNETTIYNVFA